ncbi:MAG: hypothetical protein AB1403_08905 [Candidatus Riflebacteria bacterium]
MNLSTGKKLIENLYNCHYNGRMKNKRLNLKNCLFSLAIASALLLMNCLGISGGHFDFCTSEQSHEHNNHEKAFVALHDQASTLCADINHHSSCQDECCPVGSENHQHQADYLGSSFSVENLFRTLPIQLFDKPVFFNRFAVMRPFNTRNDDVRSDLLSIHQSVCLII